MNIQDEVKQAVAAEKSKLETWLANAKAALIGGALIGAMVGFILGKLL